jgi:nitrite reductase/ring-hydroxylating ferredoxin subunit
VINDEGNCLGCERGVCPAGRTSRRTFLQKATVIMGTTAAALGLTSRRGEPSPLSPPDGPHAAEARYPIPATDGATIDHGAQLIVSRFKGHVAVFALSCPHQNNAVKWLPKDHRFQCTKHDSQYQADGVHTSGRATRNLDRYVIRREGDVVVDALHHWIQSDQDSAAWSAATVAV